MKDIRFHCGLLSNGQWFYGLSHTELN